ncbi:hypothetical protein AKJ65_04660 [candidate division MSBL1 archaeon SCGC-AAA259E19]|uniref:Uncharacterized protein n=1 Tax=candidate division MSBL1 archaeon SCGC-AAA259E19 TaxID=1698264 RepID=A0A133UJG5_9EURY|nr:hypothetical protein AKJ65_04660 [candidate division MSBL1 archaeon SCGC-AAA259E19]
MPLFLEFTFFCRSYFLKIVDPWENQCRISGAGRNHQRGSFGSGSINFGSPLNFSLCPKMG